MTVVRDSLLCPRWLLDADGSKVLRNQAVAIRDGRIDAVGPRTQFGSNEDLQTVELAGHLLVPGLINAHTHAAMSLFRGLGDDLPLERWLEERIWPLEQRFVDADFVALGTELAIAEMIRGGVTAAMDMYFFPDVAAATAKAIGFRLNIGLLILEFPTVWAASTDEYFAKATALHDDWKGDPLISSSLAPHAPYTVGDESFRRIRIIGDQLDIPIHMHVHETQREVDEARAKTGLRPLARIRALGLLHHGLAAVHMTALQDKEMEELATAGVCVTHCPESNLKLASGVCPVHALHQHGVRVAIGTDGAASNNDLDVLGELRTAALVGKWRARDAAAMPVTSVIAMATSNGAYAMAQDDSLGRIDVGRQADLVAVDLYSLESFPLHDPLSNLLYATPRTQITDVWIAGRRVLEDRTLTTIDEQRLRDRVAGWAARLRDEAAVS